MKENEIEEYEMFIYSNLEEDDGNPPYCEYFDNEIEAIERAKTATTFIESHEYVEVWKIDEEGYFGNCGEPIYKSDN